MRNKVLVPLGAAVAMTLGTVFAVPAFGQSATVIPNSAAPNLSSFQDLGQAPAGAQMNLVVFLKLHNQSTLQQLIADHQKVTPSQFRAQFSPSSSSYQAVENQLQHAGLTVNSTSSDNMVLDVTGTVAQIQSVFGTSVHQFKDQHGNTFLANTTNDHVSGALAAHMSGAAGIDQYADPRPMDVSQASLAFGDTPKQTSTTPNAFSFFNGNHSANIQTAYHFTPVYTQYGLDGSGQTIAVVDAYGSPTIQSDLEMYQQQVEQGAYGATDPLNLQVIAPPGVFVKAAQNPIKSGDAAGWATEVSMDVELSHAVAPGAKIVLVATPNNGADLYMGVNHVINGHLANQMSLSFGSPEQYTPANERQAINQMFEQAVAEGINVFVSAGDWGNFTQPPFNEPQPMVSFPASDPNVVAVGGSSLFVNQSGSYGTEIPWGEQITKIVTPKGTVEPGFFLFGTGGGTSSDFAKPSWQTGVPGLSNTNMRQVPDVAYNADPYTGFALVVNGQVQDGWGGTSDAAPQWAAITALANEGHVNRTGTSLPFIDPILYAHGQAAFHDVLAGQLHVKFVGSVSGDTYYMTMGSDTSLNAGPGWDNTTGLGTPNVQAVVNELMNSN